MLKKFPATLLRILQKDKKKLGIATIVLILIVAGGTAVTVHLLDKDGANPAQNTSSANKSEDLKKNTKYTLADVSPECRTVSPYPGAPATEQLCRTTVILKGSDNQEHTYQLSEFGSVTKVGTPITVEQFASLKGQELSLILKTQPNSQTELSSIVINQ